MKKALKFIKKFKMPSWVWWVSAAILVLLILKPVISFFTGIYTSVKGIFSPSSTPSGADVHSTDIALPAWSPALSVQYPQDITLTASSLDDMSETIYNDWSFNHANFDETFGTFKMCSNQVEISALCAHFFAKYQQDLQTYLTPGFLYSLWNLRGTPTDDQYLQISNYVKGLPIHK